MIISNFTYQIAQIQQKKTRDQHKLGQKLESVQAAAEKEKDLMQVQVLTCLLKRYLKKETNENHIDYRTHYIFKNVCYSIKFH